MTMLIEDNSLVLFQGDSVTDAGRTAVNEENLGMGYPFFISGLFSALYPEKHVKFINRGVSGDRTINLKNRWQEDTIDLKPDVLSILIGINDCWRRYDSNDPTSVEKFEENYRYILDETKEKTDAKIIMCEPFVLPSLPDRKEWRVDLDPKIHIVRNLAREYGAILVPLDGVFAQAASLRKPEFWTPDGVHPSPAGHALIARVWLDAVGAKL